MRRVLLLSLTAGLALLSLAAVPPRSAVTRSAVDLRAAASLRAPVLARIPRARTVGVQACARRWCSVSYRTARGFVPEAALAQAGGLAGARCGRDHFVNRRGECVHVPDEARDGQPPPDATVRCWDGKFSHSTEPHGRCSSHGGTPD